MPARTPDAGSITAAACFLLAAIGSGAAAAAPAPTDLSRLPVIAGDSGVHLGPAAHQDGPLLVNFWASWCVPCRAELPSLERLAARRQDLVVMAVSVDADRRDARNAFAGRYPHLRLGYAPIDAVRAYGALGIPYSVLFDRHGHEAARVPRALAWDVEGARYLGRPDRH